MSKLGMGCAALERHPSRRIGGKLTPDDLADPSEIGARKMPDFGMGISGLAHRSGRCGDAHHCGLPAA
jgi:hypothetical protein